MKKIIIALSLMLTVLSACVYKPNVQQGNVLDQKDVNKIKPGMSKEQIAFILGKPVLDTNLENNTWYYLYYLIPSRGDRVEKRMVLTFKDDRLETIDGTVKPQSEEEQAAAEAEKNADK